MKTSIATHLNTEHEGNEVDRAQTEADVSRRNALGRLAQYTAPIIVAALVSEQAIAQSGGSFRRKWERREGW
jgi:hypothetical protein